MTFNFVGVAEALERVRRINVMPLYIKLRDEMFRELVVANVPEGDWDTVEGMLLCGLPVVIDEDGLDRREFAVCVEALLAGPCADDRRGRSKYEQDGHWVDRRHLEPGYELHQMSGILGGCRD